MSTHNISFHGEIRKYHYFFVERILSGEWMVMIQLVIASILSRAISIATYNIQNSLGST